MILASSFGSDLQTCGLLPHSIQADIEYSPSLLYPLHYLKLRLSLLKAESTEDSRL